MGRAIESGEAVFERAGRVIPGACVGQIPPYPPAGPIIASGSGSRVTDTTGRSYIDYVMGSGPMLLGHAHPEVVEAVRKQAGLGSTFYALTEWAVNLAEKVVGAASCGNALRFQSTGAEATQASLRIARAATGRSKILKFDGSWHGTYDIALVSLAGPNAGLKYECQGLPESALQDVLVTPYNDLEAAEEQFRKSGHDIAAIIIEPVQRGIPPFSEFLKGLRKLADQYGALLIFDEVVTGFRLAWGGAQGFYGVTPDLACYGKVIGGGYPVSAVVGDYGLVSLADPVNKGKGSYVFMGGTLTANPVSCAAGCATLDVLDTTRPYGSLEAKALRLAQRLRGSAERVGQALQVSQTGSILQLYFGDVGVVRNAFDAARSDKQQADRFAKALLSLGIYTVPNGKLYVSVAHSDADIEATADIAHEALQAIV
jgi:glutamate-1-semialdehyde 2,1-aminomutase